MVHLIAIFSACIPEAMDAAQQVGVTRFAELFGYKPQARAFPEQSPTM